MWKESIKQIIVEEGQCNEQYKFVCLRVPSQGAPKYSTTWKVKIGGKDGKNLAIDTKIL